MKKIQITKPMLGIRHNHDDCIYCGLNTNLLPEDQKIESDHKKYCRHCFLEGVDKKQVIPRDFYGKRAFQAPSAEEIQQSLNYNRACSLKCQNLKGLEIAHLYGEKGAVNQMHMDLYLDRENGDIYFRLTLCDEDDDWYKTEVREYIRPDRAIELLNKNDIHLLDGLTEENWKEYFDFFE